MLACEGALDNAAACAAAAAGVHDKLTKHLAPLIGRMGVTALLQRSAALTMPQHPFISANIAEDTTQLRACLENQDAAVAAHAAVALVANFLALITTFVGERLTAQALRSAWPSLTDAAHGKKTT